MNKWKRPAPHNVVFKDISLGKEVWEKMWKLMWEEGEVGGSKINFEEYYS